MRGAALAAAGLGLGARPRPTPVPTATPAPDPVAEGLFSAAKQWWRMRDEVPYVSYGALIRYKHAGHVFDNWWNAAYRSSDRALHLEHITIADDDAKRLKGFPLTIFGFKIFDTNPDAEPIRIEEPVIDPVSDFGVMTRYRSVVNASGQPTPNPLLYEPEPGATPLHEIGHVEAATRDYDIRVAGEETLRHGDAYHLTLRPLHDPAAFRLRDLWIAKDSFATLQLNVAGIFNGLPYDAALWTVSYVPLGGRWYVQQVRARDLSFGFGVHIEAMEFDFVDYRFPKEVPPIIFERLL